MYGPDDGSAVALRPAPGAAGASGWFSPGDPVGGQLPTLLETDFLNGVLAELLSVLAAAAVTPSKTQVDQLLTSIRALVVKGAAGGVYKGVQAWSSSQTLTAAQVCQYLSLLSSGPAITIPLANSAIAGTPMDFVVAAAPASLVAQGGNAIATGLASVGTLSLTAGDKVRLVSDGVSTWWLAMKADVGLKLISSQTISSPTQKIEVTWAPGLYSEFHVLCMEVATQTNAAAVNFAVGSSSGWSAGLSIGGAGGATHAGASVIGGQNDRSLVHTGFDNAGGVQGNNTIVGGQSGAAGAMVAGQARHDGGCAGVRIGTANSANPLVSGTVLVYAKGA